MLCLICCETKHNALISSAFILLTGCVNPLRNIYGLLMNMNIHIHILPMETLLLIANILNYAAGGLFNMTIIVGFSAFALPEPVTLNKGAILRDCAFYFVVTVLLWVFYQFNTPSQIEAPALTFLIAASGMSLFGVSGAFWGVLVGAIVWFAKAMAKRDTA